MQTVGEKEYYGKEAAKLYGDIREALHLRINSVLTGGRKDIVVSPEITNAIDLIIDRLQDAVQYQIKAELAKHGISSVEGNDT